MVQTSQFIGREKGRDSVVDAALALQVCDPGVTHRTQWATALSMACAYYPQIASCTSYF